MTKTNDRVLVLDTTLRDGEQSPGCSMTVTEKVRIAAQLEALGVDVIEAGFPSASDGDFAAVQAIAEQSREVVVCGLARCLESDLRRTAEAVAPAGRPRIHTFIATSPLHMRVKLCMTPDQVLDRIRDSVRFARNLCPDVEWSAEDATRSDADFLAKAVEIAIDAGASTINLPDTVGYATPETYSAMFRDIMGRVPNADRVIYSTHCHDDLGMAVANTLAGVSAGARQIEGTINGIGERAGNAAIEEVVMALHVRGDIWPLQTRIVKTEIARSSALVCKTLGIEVQPNKAIVGANAFAHESGIHQDGMLKDSSTYEIMRPASVGRSGSRLVLGKHSGRAAFRQKLQQLGYSPGDVRVDSAFTRFKQVIDRCKSMVDADIVALVEEVIP